MCTTTKILIYYVSWHVETFFGSTEKQNRFNETNFNVLPHHLYGLERVSTCFSVYEA